MLMLGGVACTTNNLDGGNDLDGGNPDDNDTNELHSQIWYTATEKVTPSAPNVFGANIVSNEWNSLTLEGVITFDGEVTSIGDDAFYYCTSLESITIPNSVTEIGVRAFSNCTSLAEFNGKFASEDGRCLIIDGVLNSFAPYGLTEYTIPEGVTSIGDYAFSGCKSLTSITIPEGVTSIGYEAFGWCESLESITIPDSVTSIGDDAFLGCWSLVSITIPEGVTSIGNFAFNGCSSLASITIPEGVTSIGGAAFCGCSSLASITIPEGVTSIGDDAFAFCSSLTSITIPDSVTEIGYEAFSWCSSLAEVYCKATTPPMGGDYMFENNASERKIYVPSGSVEAYKTAEKWSNYADAIGGYGFE